MQHMRGQGPLWHVKAVQGKKKKDARRVKEELKETTKEDSDTKEEKEVNRVIRDQVWLGVAHHRGAGGAVP